MILPLTNKTAIITGASRGIGLAIAQALARAGATTYLVARNQDALADAARSINNSFSSPPAYPPRAIPVPGDVSLPATWDTITSHFQNTPNPNTNHSHNSHKPDILVNAAGIAQAALLTKTTPEDVDALLGTNLRAVVLGCRAVGRLMVRRPRAEREDGQLSIVNVSSVMATHGQAGASVYAASKAGILGLTSALSREFGHFGVRVNAILPGYIDTDMLKGQLESKLSSKIPLGRLGRPEEVADAAAFLACNPYANNCHLTLDGGLSGTL